MSVSGPSSFRREIEIETWTNIIQEIYPDDQSIQIAIEILGQIVKDSEDIQSQDGSVKVDTVIDQLSNQVTSIQDRNIQILKVKSFIEEMQSYLSLLTSLTSSLGDGLQHASRENFLPEHAKLIGGEFKSAAGEVSKVSGNVTLAVDTLDCILRTVRHTQLLYKVKKNLDAIEEYMKFEKIAPEDKKRYKQACKQFEFFLNDHKKKLEQNIFFLSTSWSRFLLNTTNSILQNAGVSSVITSSLSWAGSILGIISSSVRFHHTKVRYDKFSTTLQEYKNEQYQVFLPEKTELDLSKPKGPTSEGKEGIYTQRVPTTKKSENWKAIQELTNKRKEEEKFSVLKDLENYEIVKKFVAENATSPLLFSELIQKFGVNPDQVMENFIQDFLREIEKKFKSKDLNLDKDFQPIYLKAYLSSLTNKVDFNERYLIAYLTALPAIEIIAQSNEDFSNKAKSIQTTLQGHLEALKDPENLKSAAENLKIDVESLKKIIKRTRAAEHQLLQEYQINRDELAKMYVHNKFGTEDLEAQEEFISFMQTHSKFQEGIGKAYSQFQRTSLIQSLKSANALNVEKNQHEGKVADFNYKKSSILFGITLAVSTASLILSILLFCSVIGAVPAIVFAVAPLLMLFSSATSLVVGIHFLKKHRPSLYSKIYPAKIRYFAGALVELIMRVNLYRKKQSFARFIKKHHFKRVETQENLVYVKREDPKLARKYERHLNQLAAAAEKLSQRKIANEQLSGIQVSAKQHDYIQAVRLDDRIHYRAKHSQAVEGLDFKNQLEQDHTLYQETMESLAKVFFHPNVPLNDELIAFFEIKMGINMTFYLDDQRRIKVDQYGKIGKELRGYFSQDDDDLLITMGRSGVRKQHLDRLLGTSEVIDY